MTVLSSRGRSMIRKLLSVDMWHQIDKLIITVVLSISKIVITLNPHLGFC